MGETCKKTVFEMANTNLNNICLVLLSMTISWLDTFILHLEEVLYQHEIQTESEGIKENAFPGMRELFHEE